MSTIYDELSILFKLSQELNEIIEIENEVDYEEKKELAEDFITHIMNLSNITNSSNDEIFMRDNYINNNANLIRWIKQNNYIDERRDNFFNNLQANYKNEKDLNQIILENNEINNKNKFIDNKEEDSEGEYDDNDMLNSKQSSINLIKQNYMNNKKNKIEKNVPIDLNSNNKFDIKESKINFNNIINNNGNNQINNINQINKDNIIEKYNINNQKNNNNEELNKEEEYEEEEVRRGRRRRRRERKAQ